MAQCCIAGLWLLHNFLDESHQISQGINTSTGSFWHGIMHRREPDYSNAKYWFRRVGNHPTFGELGDAARGLASSAPADRRSEYLKSQSHWDPFQFVDLCETAAAERGELEQLCVRVAEAEWRLLFDYCYHQAIGGDPISG